MDIGRGLEAIACAVAIVLDKEVEIMTPHFASGTETMLKRPSFFMRTAMLCLLLLAPGATFAQSDASIYAPGSGDAWIDRHLADMNDYATRYPQSFVDEVSRYYSVPREYVEALLQQPDWEPGDVFMACALGRILAQPCRKVVRERSREHAEGWRGVASRMQSRPDQPVTQELRKNIRESYGRWARPLMK